MKNALFISGGGTKIPFLAAASSNIIHKHNVNFKYIVGVSAGAILSLPLAMGLHDEIEEMVIGQTDKSIFKYSPNSLKGKLIAFYNVITGKPNLYNDENLEKVIKSVITKERFNRYKYSKDATICYVIVVDIETGEELIINLKQSKYEDAIQYVLASSSIPVYVGPRKVDGRYLYDGGLRSHIGSYKFLKNHSEKVRNCISIFSRAEELTTYKWNFPKKKLFSFNIAKVLFRVIEIMNIEISKSDEYKADFICEQKGITHLKIFAPFKLSSSPYENSVKLNQEMWDVGIEESEKIVYDGFTNTTAGGGFFDISDNTLNK